MQSSRKETLEREVKGGVEPKQGLVFQNNYCNDRTLADVRDFCELLPLKT